MVASEVLNKERKIKQDSRGKTTHHRQLGKARLRAAADLVWSRLSLGEKTASIHSCGNLIGPLFLAARSQTEILPPRLCLKVFSSGRLSLTFPLSHRPNWILPLPANPGSQLMHLLLTPSHCILIICLQMFSPPDRAHILWISACSIELNIVGAY